MTAVRAPASSSIHPAIGDFIQDGAHVFDRFVDPIAAAALLADIRATRPFDHRLFLSEAEFDADPQHVGVNPRPGRNLLERFEDRLGFVEQAPHITSALQALLGDGYEILNRKVVCGVPQTAVPPWLRARILGNPVNNLGAYVRPEHRDVTYFYGIDFHQDLIDYRDRPADFLTLYVYLHPVSRLDAPLFLLTGSHRLGAAVFPHDLRRDGPDVWTYRDGRGGEVKTHQRLLTGPAGFAAIWHACTLHGTQPDAADHERISLRYLVAKGPGAAGLDQVNATLHGPLALPQTRLDLAADGQAVIKGNIVNQA
ncbi:MAG: phytanoyl-CoA dioxygenase family protein [Phenylobacterium sp.]|uniref:phytanoyl-CoA dioxygenase family protein n=1 Tax=Phenylobacterium sp. TaxID=1871053 RepID=UPI00271E70D8|nr:phytanoyl-CoA dioxygenase family protein [Phenylobacterium sp.]MDO8902508.1 phytanoyl-CoA dioxygenase family protein [Phenylobacterium sp.]MDP2213292.1 phytanoyl-CoA dioxygenase family protein [Phenylobacterium sp.]